ncbi:hypothetical protein [Agrobacterium tumefaciens]|uniref:hypothetical protein n=1 Tax=Agrobacterium tumefaciens TaxID=358 RepID=UPI0021D0A9C8|nr:hypothetical protein [Agrobacterium tumefaciens]UXS01131.1 hypothetical protein FY156_06310 [Agrobacterium tumefaciens]
MTEPVNRDFIIKSFTEVDRDLVSLTTKRVGDAVNSVMQLVDTPEKAHHIGLAALTAALGVMAGTHAAYHGENSEFDDIAYARKCLDMMQIVRSAKNGTEIEKALEAVPDEAKIKHSIEAISYLLNRSQRDDRLYYQIGFGTESFRLLTVALAALTDVDHASVEKRYSR